jgi:hypothetical protein
MSSLDEWGSICPARVRAGNEMEKTAYGAERLIRIDCAIMKSDLINDSTGSCYEPIESPGIEVDRPAVPDHIILTVDRRRCKIEVALVEEDPSGTGSNPTNRRDAEDWVIIWRIEDAVPGDETARVAGNVQPENRGSSGRRRESDAPLQD